MNKIIGISGLAGDGKDSLCNMLRPIFESSGFAFERIALADAIKDECKEALLSLYGIDPIVCSREDKARIRDFLVFHGKVKRIETQGTHWTSKVSNVISNLPAVESDRIICIPDIRHAEYEKDEVQWLKKNGGILIHVKKYNIENCYPYKRSYSIAVNDQEAIHTPKVEYHADFVLEWQDSSPLIPQDSYYCNESVAELFKMILSQINETKIPTKAQKKRKTIEKLKKI